MSLVPESGTKTSVETERPCDETPDTKDWRNLFTPLVYRHRGAAVLSFRGFWIKMVRVSVHSSQTMRIADFSGHDDLVFSIPWRNSDKIFLRQTFHWESVSPFQGNRAGKDWVTSRSPTSCVADAHRRKRPRTFPFPLN